METLQRTANRGSVSTGYDVGNSLKVESDNDEYLERPTSSPDGNSTQHTISVWVKRTELGVDSEPVSAGGIGRFRFESDDTFSYQFRSGKEIITTRKFRDTGSWYHIVAAADSSQSTASNRMKLYVNGVQETSFGTANYQDQNQAAPGWGKNTLYSLRVGAAASNTRNFNGYIAEMYYIDGQTLDPTYFGEFDEDSNIWKPKAFTGTHGSLDTYLDFSDSSNLGKNSGGTTDLGATNITAADQATDTPTNNFCTFNPLMADNNAPTISEGATKATGGGGTWNRAFGTQGIKNGKWYYEFKVTNTSSSGYFGASTTPAENSETLDAQFMYNTSFVVGNPARIDYYYWQNGSQVSNESTGWGTISANDIIGVALDLDASTKKFYIYKNGSLVNSGGTDLPTNMQDEFIFPLYVQYENRQDEVNLGGYTISSISSAVSDGNGYGNFEYMPSGYYAICSKNIAQYG